MALTEATLKNAKHADKAYKLAHGFGMFLLIKPNGSRLWRLKYRFAGKEKLLALGSYPEVSLTADDAELRSAIQLSMFEERHARALTPMATGLGNSARQIFS